MMKKNKKIIGLTFPGDNHLKVGLEPSVLCVLPHKENVEFCYDNRAFHDRTVENYFCSVYITGFEEFKAWAKKHDKQKIIVGGYHPTMFPEQFLNYAEKIIMGPCDDIEATLGQEDVLYEKSYHDNGNFVEGKILKTMRHNPGMIRRFGEITDSEKEKPSGKSEIFKDRILPGVLTFKNTPLYHVYDITYNQQIIPDKRPDDPVTSINTSFGCFHNCEFCCSPVMFGNNMTCKPPDLLKREVKILKERLERGSNGKKQKFMFIRDENFTFQKDYREKLEIISKSGAKIYLFSSANTLTEEVVKTLAEHNVYLICLGLEDPQKEYLKNRDLFGVVERLKKNGIFVYLSFIVDPLKVIDEDKEKEFYDLLYKKFEELRPEMVCGNFLMPFPGTPLWGKYAGLINEEDFKYYDSKTPFLIKDRKIHDRTRKSMFEVQWKYYTSDLYNKEVRNFETGDTLHLRFLELKKEFTGY
ncbi:MAG: radical SAM protein [Candidatus Eremiobacterota bacterium]